MIYIGIDTGVNTGIAIWDTHKQSFELVTSMPIHRAMDEVKKWKEVAAEKKTDIKVRVEDPRVRKWYGNYIDREEERRKLQGVGSVKRDAGIWEAFLDDLDVYYEMVPPKNIKTKLSSSQFFNLTGWKKRTNEHSRDAAMLVFGY